MTREEELDGYGLLWSELRASERNTTYRISGSPRVLAPRKKGAIVLDLIAHCGACFRLYESKRGTPEYDASRASLWLRRWYLHTVGMHSLASARGTHPAWRESYEEGGGVLP